MANADIREFYFYEQYLWRPQDFNNLQTWLRDTARAIAEGGFGSSILSGLTCAPGGGLNVNVASGIAVNSDGRPLVSGGGVAALASDPSNPRRAYIVLRPVDTNTNLINEPVNPTNQVPLHKQLGCSITVILGTPAATPVYPATQSGDVVLMGLLIPTGTVTIASSMFEYYEVELPRKRRHSIRQISGGGLVNISIDDDIIEIDSAATGTICLLPSAQEAANRDFKFVKTDSSVNEVAVSGNGGELISGNTSQEIVDQWGFVRCYSNGIAWRMF